MGRAFAGDGIATVVAGYAGGTGVTTYAENIGVMAVTKIYSTIVFVVAAVIAIVLGFSPKFGALIQTIPGAVLGGVSIVVFGLIAIAGAKIWVDNRVDFSRNRNLIIAAVTLVLGRGRLRAVDRRLHARRHRHRDVRRDPAEPAAARRDDARRGSSGRIVRVARHRRRRCAAVAPDRSRARCRRASRLPRPR